MTPASEAFYAGKQPHSASATINEELGNTEEVSRLKLQLAQAQDKISRLDQELTSTRFVPQALDLCNPRTPFEPDCMYNMPPEVKQSQNTGMHSPVMRGFGMQGRDSTGPWSAHTDSRSDTGEPLHTAGFSRARHIWNNRQGHPAFGQLNIPPNQVWNNHRTGNGGFGEGEMPYSAPIHTTFRSERVNPEPDFEARPGASRRAPRVETRLPVHIMARPSAFDSAYPYGSDSGPEYGGPPAVPVPGSMHAFPGYGPMPNMLSPLASEFTASSDGEPWKTDVSLASPEDCVCQC